MKTKSAVMVLAGKKAFATRMKNIRAKKRRQSMAGVKAWATRSKNSR